MVLPHSIDWFGILNVRIIFHCQCFLIESQDWTVEFSSAYLVTTSDRTVQRRVRQFEGFSISHPEDGQEQQLTQDTSRDSRYM